MSDNTAGERFTPGPWDIGMTSNNANANIIYKRIPEKRFGDKAIASIYGLPINTPLDEMGRWADGEDMANARLISAAPDLHQAASALLADVRSRYPGEALRCPFMIALDAAVNKADGRTPAVISQD